MKATTLHTKITKFMEANNFSNECVGQEGTSSFALEAPGQLPLLIDFIYEDGDEEIEVSIDEICGNSVDSLEREFFSDLEEVKEFISDYFNL
jgi:hypothetical protein